MIDVALLAKVFRAAADGYQRAAWTEGMVSTGDFRDIAKANAAAFGSIAQLFEKLAVDDSVDQL